MKVASNPVEPEDRSKGRIVIHFRAQLLPVEGGAPLELTKDVTLVGRKEDCDLRLEHKSVSKLHCVLVKTDGLILLRDLGSTNGTRVNGQRVRRAALLPNDKVTIAGFQFKVFLGPASQPPVTSDENTQYLDADEVAKALGKHGELADSVVDEPLMKIQANPLPDLYPDEQQRQKKR